VLWIGIDILIVEGEMVGAMMSAEGRKKGEVGARAFEMGGT